MARTTDALWRLSSRQATPWCGQLTYGERPARKRHCSPTSRLPSSQSLRVQRDEEWRQHQRDRAQQLDDHMQRRSRCVLEGIADGVADDAGLVRERALAERIAIVVLEEARLDVF